MHSISTTLLNLALIVQTLVVKQWSTSKAVDFMHVCTNDHSHYPYQRCMDFIMAVNAQVQLSQEGGGGGREGNYTRALSIQPMQVRVVTCMHMHDTLCFLSSM